MADRELRRELFEFLLDSPAIMIKNQLIYVSGYTGLDFFDADSLFLSPKTNSLMAGLIANTIKQAEKDGLHINKLAFLEKNSGTVGAITLTGMICQMTGFDAVILKHRVPCECKQCTPGLRVKGSNRPPLSQGDRVLVIEDVITTGRTIEEAADLVSRTKAEVVSAVVLLDRLMGSRERLKKRGIELYSILDRTTLIELGYIPPTKEDISSLDFFSDISNIVSLTTNERSEIEANLNSLTKSVLEGKGMPVTDENQRALRNMLLAFTFNIRTKAPWITVEPTQ